MPRSQDSCRGRQRGTRPRPQTLLSPTPSRLQGRSHRRFPADVPKRRGRLAELRERTVVGHKPRAGTPTPGTCAAQRGGSSSPRPAFPPSPHSRGPRGTPAPAPCSPAGPATASSDWGRRVCVLQCSPSTPQTLLTPSCPPPRDPGELRKEPAGGDSAQGLPQGLPGRLCSGSRPPPTRRAGEALRARLCSQAGGTGRGRTPNRRPRGSLDLPEPQFPRVHTGDKTAAP